MNPVEQAILPIKFQAIEQAGKDARARVAQQLAILAENDWNLDVVAPRPDSLRDDNKKYSTKKNLRSSFYYFCVTDETRGSGKDNRWGSPTYLLPSRERQDDYVSKCEAIAAVQYDMFVEKLVGKIGECDSAEIDGNHVWGHSILTVRKGDNIERWKTHRILNVSKLGTVFNQWPSRKIK